MEKYVLTSGQPVRASAISALLDLAGAILIVVGLDRSATALIVIGVVLFVLGIALAVVAAVFRIRLRTEVQLDATGISITSGGRTAAAVWSDITGVTRDARAIYLARDKTGEPELKINSPRGSNDPQFVRLSTVLSERLAHDRGYRPL